MENLINKITEGQHVTIYGDTKIISGKVASISKINQTVVILSDITRDWFVISAANLHTINAIR